MPRIRHEYATREAQNSCYVSPSLSSINRKTTSSLKYTYSATLTLIIVLKHQKTNLSIERFALGPPLAPLFSCLSWQTSWLSKTFQSLEGTCSSIATHSSRHLIIVARPPDLSIFVTWLSISHFSHYKFIDIFWQ